MMTASSFPVPGARWAGIVVLAATVCAALPCPAPAQEIDGLAAAAALEQAFVKVIAEAEPSVVSILRYRPPAREQVQFDIERWEPLPRRRRFQQHSIEPPPEHPDFVPNEFGSGIVIQPPAAADERLILTNYHVVKGGPVFGRPGARESGPVQLYVRFANRKGCQAEIFAADPRSDLAVLKLLPETGDVRLADLRPLPLGDGGGLRKGQIVLALGNPYALARDGSASATWGMISNVGRRAAPLEDFRFDSETRKQLTVHHFGTLLQVTMPLDLGTSGGALLNLRGELIGVTTSLAALDGYEKSVGHAVPLDEATRRAIHELSQGFEVEYGLLGIELDTVLQVHQPGIGQPSAAVATRVGAGSPAARAGLRADDVITAVDGLTVHSRADLMREIGNRPPGSEVRLRVWSPFGRGGRMTEVSAVLAKWMPINEDDIIATRHRPGRQWRGLVIDYPTARRRLAPQPEPYDAVLLTEVSAEARVFSARTPGERVELRPGDYIERVNGTPVRDPVEFQRVVANLPGEARLTLVGRPDEVIVRP